MSTEENKNEVNEPNEAYVSDKDLIFERNKALVHKAYEESKREDAVWIDSETLKKRLRATVEKWM